MPGQLVETDVETDPAAELSGVYRYVGAGGTVRCPTRVDGPAMLFNNIKGHPGAKVAIGILAGRQRVAALFGCRKEELGHLVRILRRVSGHAGGHGGLRPLPGGRASGFRAGL